MDQFREFSVGPDPYGRTFQVRFLWQQTAISIRHSDSVDCKFLLDDGALREEKVIALMHTHLQDLARKLGRALNDAWCLKLAALHLKRMILSGDDMEKPLVTMTASDLERANQDLESLRAVGV